MRFADINAERFGVLKNAELAELSPGLTVVYGGNGSGKTTMVHFLRGLLFGFTADHQAFHEADERFGGSLTLETRGRSLRLTRERSYGRSSELSVVDLGTGKTVSAHSASLPEWINESVHREIFTVGDQEAARFDLLTRLCLDGTRSSADDEIRRTELAIRQSMQEREGNGLEGGLRQRIASLRQQREDLVRKLAELRKSNPEIPARIAAVESELQRLRASLVGTEQQISEVRLQIRRLEELLESLRSRNQVTLDRSALEEQIERLNQRRLHWEEIRQMIRRELTALRSNPGLQRQCRDSLTSIRALVARLEQRVSSGTGDNLLYHSETFGSARDGFPRDGICRDGISRDVIADHIRGEVFSLCEYVRRHEAAIEAHEASLETLIGQRVLSDAENIDAVLQGQIDALREELARSRDVIAPCRNEQHACSSAAHSEWARSVGPASVRSIEDIEAELAQLRRRPESLTAEQAGTTARIRQLEEELERLRAQLRTAAALEDVDRLRTRIAETDAQLALAQERYDTLERAETQLHAVIERLRNVQSPQVLELASRYVQRLTDGDCFRLRAAENGYQILAETRQSQQAQTIPQLSRGTRDQVALALRLALIQSRAQDTDRCPLILDDVFITADDERAAAIADLLMEIAADGQQILFFTCQNDVRDLFARRRAAIRTLDNVSVASPVSRPATVPLPVVAAAPVIIPPPVITPAVAPATAAALPREGTNWLFYLELDNSVEDLSGLTVAEVEAFRSSGIQAIDQLLTLSVDDLEARFRQHGYSISRDRIRAWRGQAELSTLVPMLRRSDAELLYAAGIENTVELSRMRPETVFEMVTRFQTTPAGTRFRKDGRTIDRQQAINWSRWSQHSRLLSDARRSRSRFFVKSDDHSHNTPFSSQDRLPRSSESSVSQRRRRISGTGTAVRRQPRPTLSSERRREREERISRRRRRLSAHSASYRTRPTESATETAERELRFYLNRGDDVEAAPSIGPRTAQRLGKVGSYIVADPLSANAPETAAQLQNPRI
ncbi:MAG: DUF4332 domain-containing protein, partial [Planctomycetaceae bacterium]|nr:DUF4332 domain-containing protein [Planctomycetaceae bacterium]